MEITFLLGIIHPLYRNGAGFSKSARPLSSIKSSFIINILYGQSPTSPDMGKSPGRTRPRQDGKTANRLTNAASRPALRALEMAPAIGYQEPAQRGRPGEPDAP